METTDPLIREFITCYDLVDTDCTSDKFKERLLGIFSKFVLTNHTHTKAIIEESELYLCHFSMFHFLVGYYYSENQMSHRSLVHYSIALKLETENNKLIASILHNIGVIYQKFYQNKTAIHYIKRGLELFPNDPDLNFILGCVLLDIKDFDMSEHYLQLALENLENIFITGDKEQLKRNILIALSLKENKCSNYTKADHYISEARKLGNCLVTDTDKASKAVYHFTNKEELMEAVQWHKDLNKYYDEYEKYRFKSWPTFPKIINIGFVSGDFVNHPVEFFISSYLSHFDRRKFRIFCFTTRRINKKIEYDCVFKDISSMDVVAAAKLIYDYRIQILVDLSGITAYNKLEIFAMKPAPIQVSYIGYPFTTGLKQMDYRITDEICEVDVQKSKEQYSEKLICLPDCFTCFNPDIFTEIPTISPRVDDGFIRLGSMNRFNKMTPETLSLFNEILKSNDRILFYVKTRAFNNEFEVNEFKKYFDERVKDRIEIFPDGQNQREHMERYNLLDYTVDTFPYSGTTTSCDSLYMGVPVFTIYNTELCCHVSNVTTSLLINSDLSEYVCHNQDEMIQKINAHTYNSNLKETVREKFLSGKVCNKCEYAKNLDTAFEQLSEIYQVS